MDNFGGKYQNVVTKTNCPSCGAPATFNYTNPSDVCPFCYSTIPQFSALIQKLRTEKMEHERELNRQKQEHERLLAWQKQDQEAKKALAMQMRQQEHEAEMTVIKAEKRRESRDSFIRSTGSCCGTALFKIIFGLVLSVGIVVALLVYLPQILEYALKFKISFWEALLKKIFG